ncbi:acyl-CoA dehydrogenase family protein, partial [Streptomyces sp. NPDC007027]|uniref:acyl-CoA dehydrogenase family protein n=1 Tax=Streptomyces sp. NPDC007027 TaxID=3157086 RepID=UPI003451AB27
ITKPPGVIRPTFRWRTERRAWTAWTAGTEAPAESAEASPGAGAAVAAAKVAAGEAGYAAARTALQLHGAIGYTEELDLAWWLRRARPLRDAWGTPSACRARVLAG